MSATVLLKTGILMKLMKHNIAQQYKSNPKKILEICQL